MNIGPNPKTSRTIGRIARSPEGRKQRSEICKKAWADPVIRAKRILTMRLNRQPGTPYRIKWKITSLKNAKVRGEKIRKSWLNPKVRAARLARSSPNGLEIRMMDLLDELRLQYKFQGTINGLTYIPDFIIGKVVLECDGQYHSTPEGIERDKKKNTAYRKAGYQVLRFTTNQILYDEDEVVDSILEVVGES